MRVAQLLLNNNRIEYIHFYSPQTVAEQFRIFCQTASYNFIENDRNDVA